MIRELGATSGCRSRCGKNAVFLRPRILRDKLSARYQDAHPQLAARNRRRLHSEGRHGSHRRTVRDRAWSSFQRDLFALYYTRSRRFRSPAFRLIRKGQSADDFRRPCNDGLAPRLRASCRSGWSMGKPAEGIRNSCAAALRSVRHRRVNGPQTDVETWPSISCAACVLHCGNTVLGLRCAQNGGASMHSQNIGRNHPFLERKWRIILCRKAGVACLNGESFGENGPKGYLRFSFANSIEESPRKL